MKSLPAMAVVIAVGGAAPSAHALCFYGGVGNVKTTVAREFRDSLWVVRAKVLSAKDGLSEAGDSWTSYNLQVERAYKGAPPARLRFFTYRDSGGFYMDRADMALPEGHNLGGQYLLFLKPVRRDRDDPAEANGAVFVNYACGRSTAWSDVSPRVRNELEVLLRRGRR